MNGCLLGFILLIIYLSNFVRSAHYKGGTVTWKPTNSLSNASTVEIQITFQHSWTLTRYACDRNLINTQGSYYDLSASSSNSTKICQSGAALCSASLFQTINSRTLCTDYNNEVQISTGSYSEKQMLSNLTNIDIAWTGGNWADEIYIIGGSPPGNLVWYVDTHIDLTPSS